VSNFNVKLIISIIYFVYAGIPLTIGVMAYNNPTSKLLSKFSIVAACFYIIFIFIDFGFTSNKKICQGAYRHASENRFHVIFAYIHWHILPLFTGLLFLAADFKLTGVAAITAAAVFHINHRRRMEIGSSGRC
jgi:di/tricarboxylate transporter